MRDAHPPPSLIYNKRIIFLLKKDSQGTEDGKRMSVRSTPLEYDYPNNFFQEVSKKAGGDGMKTESNSERH